jgi:hypothetical protein
MNMLLHEDYAHTIPMRAYLRWKENWFWVFLDPDSSTYCLAHVSCEPVSGVAHTSFTLVHEGVKHVVSEKTALPSPFVHAPVMDFGTLRTEIVEPQTRFNIHFNNEDFEVTLDLERRMHLFDWRACADVNPDQFSLSENTGFDRAAFRHQGQSLAGTGTLRFKSGTKAGKATALSGMGYRDHSWGMRNDQGTLDHNWSFLNFPSRVFHFFKLRNTVRPEVFTMEAYVGEPRGNQVIKSFTVENIGSGPDNMPETVRFTGICIDGTTHTVTCDLKNALARLPLNLQKDAGKVYYCVENICRIHHEETGEEGYGNVEIGALIDA